MTPKEVEKLLQDLSSDVPEVDEGYLTTETDNSDFTTDSSGSDENTVYLT